MEHYGQVMKLTGKDTALVKVRQHHACAGCGACGRVFGDPEQRDILTVEVDNPIGAKEGQLVCLEIGESEMLFAAVLLYLVPLLGLLAGLFAGRSLALNHGLNGNPELWGLGLGLLLMALIFFVLRTQDKKFAKGDRFKVMITSVVNADEIPPELSAASPAGK
ncbi:MAG: SoxR reducing system RseC family protein [Firmicutes bacterium]|nr:SoxR reducing system RseC family protein [Bacillota bacterium]